MPKAQSGFSHLTTFRLDTDRKSTKNHGINSKTALISIITQLDTSYQNPIQLDCASLAQTAGPTIPRTHLTSISDFRRISVCNLSCIVFAQVAGPRSRLFFAPLVGRINYAKCSLPDGSAGGGCVSSSARWAVAAGGAETESVKGLRPMCTRKGEGMDGVNGICVGAAILFVNSRQPAANPPPKTVYLDRSYRISRRNRRHHL